MLHITDDALLLSARLYGESDAIISVLTENQGRYDGMVKGGISRRRRPDMQMGNALRIDWRARTSEQLGYFNIELITNYSAPLLNCHRRLLALRAACALLAALLPERMAYINVYHATRELLARLPAPDWQTHYLRWEVNLLAQMGFGLDLSRCAMTGAREGLAFVSTKTGRAATAEAARGYETQCLPLPAFMMETESGVAADAHALQTGFILTSHFLEPHLLDPRGKAASELRWQLRQTAMKEIETSAMLAAS